MIKMKKDAEILWILHLVLG